MVYSEDDRRESMDYSYYFTSLRILSSSTLSKKPIRKGIKNAKTKRLNNMEKTRPVCTSSTGTNPGYGRRSDTVRNCKSEHGTAALAMGATQSRLLDKPTDPAYGC
jgi:hypothetical protein